LKKEAKTFVSLAASRMERARSCVIEAGAIARAHFRTRLAIDNKLAGNQFDPVTIADRAIEHFLREHLHAQDSSLRIIGEELGTSGTGDDYWIIDPIDGTRAFISGMPTWGILLGLVMDGHAVGGIMHQPFTGETFIADPQRGARLLHCGTETALHTSTKTNLAEAILYSTDPSIIEQGGLTTNFAKLAKACRLQRWGGDCYALALVAQGSIDLMVEGLLAPYDIVPLIPIIEQAGGIITNLEGNSPLSGGSVIAAATPALHEAALAYLRAPG